MKITDKGFPLFAALVITGLLGVAFVNFRQAKLPATTAKSLSYSEFLDDVDQGKIHGVMLVGPQVRGRLSDHTVFESYAPADPDLIKTLRQKGVMINARPPPEPETWLTPIAAATLPVLLLIMGAIFFLPRVPGLGARSGLARSGARRANPAEHRVTFEDVAGIDEARDGLREIVDFLRAPGRFERLGGKVPRGVLLVGPPGTGKTLLARAIAGEAGVPFFTSSGSDFVEMFVGIGAARVRDLFARAAKSAPCIIFMDEIDAVGRRRGADGGGGNDEREQTLNQLLVEMDGFRPNRGVILIAATNRPDILDPALLRPGRFDREIVVHKPDVLGREHILGVHARRVPLADDVDLRELARTTPGFSGADLMNLVNEAALLAARREKPGVGAVEFVDAKATVMMGVERRTHVMSEEEKRLTAYREGGRALIALFAPLADPIHTVTIMTRGRSAGLLGLVAEDDRNAFTRGQLTSRLAILMGGRAAEEMVFGRDAITSGTAADIDEATRLARMMVMRWGMSEALGAVAYDDEEDAWPAPRQHMSDDTARTVALEVRKLIDAALTQGVEILQIHRTDLDTVAEALMQRETLGAADLARLLVRA